MIKLVLKIIFDNSGEIYINEKLIDKLIKKSEEQISNAHGSNKECFLIDEYALLKQKFKSEDLVKLTQLTEELEKRGVKVARTLDFSVIEQKIQGWNTEKNVLISDGYVLQQRAQGNPLLDRTNWDEANKSYQIDYLHQIDSISKEGQDFFNEFARGWIEIDRAGMRVDPSKAGNFMYDQGKGITFIDLGLSEEQLSTEQTVYEQLCVILNMNVYNKCYPEIQQSANKRLSVIMEKFKTAIIEQGIDSKVFEQVVENKMPESILENRGQSGEITQEEILGLESSIEEHIKKEEEKREEYRRIEAEKKEKDRIEREKKAEENRRLEEEDERKNGKKRQESKMYAMLNDLIKSGNIPKSEANVYEQVLGRTNNIYSDLNPNLFRKFGMLANVDEIVDGIEKKNITFDMRERRLSSIGVISDKDYAKIKISVEEYFKQYFEDFGKNTENKIKEYSEMKEKNFQGLLSEDEYVDFMLLESKLYEFSNAKELFSILGIEDSKVYENANVVLDFLQEKDKVPKEEIEKSKKRKSEIDREYLYEALQGTGITDINKLREIYEGQEGVRVSAEDLEIVLSMISDSENISPTQIKEDTVRGGVRIVDINQSTQIIKQNLSRDAEKNAELDK